MAVYFVQAGEGGPIKIGFARDVASRLVKMQVDCPLKLTALAVIIEGDQDVEAELHRRLAVARQLGEWFAPTAEVLAAVAAAMPFKPPAQRYPRVRERPANLHTIHSLPWPPGGTVVGPSEPPPFGGRRYISAERATEVAAALARLRTDDPDDWPEWWLDSVRRQGVSGERLKRHYHFHWPVVSRRPPEKAA